MAIEGKIITVDGLKHFKEKEDAAIAEKYVAQEAGKGLIETEKVTKLDGIEADADVNKLEGVKINGVDLSIGEDKKVDIKPEDLSADLAGYVKEEGFDEKVKGVVGSVYRPKGSKDNLEAIKAVETPTEGDVYNATDTGANYVYVGEGQGDDESGWDKLSETVDLSNLVKKDGDKVLVSPSDVTQITTNKDNISSLQSDMEDVVKTADITVAEDADIDGIFTPAV